MPIHSRNGNKYIDIFRDDRATYFWLHFRKDKGNLADEVLEAIRITVQDSGRDVKHIRCDNELMSSAVKELAKQKGIKLEPCPPYEKNYNSKAENGVRTVEEMIRCLLINAGMPKFMWEEAARTTSFTLNRVGSKANQDGKTPYEILNGKAPDVSFMRIFGCECHAKVPVPVGQKLTPRSVCWDTMKTKTVTGSCA